MQQAVRAFGFGLCFGLVWFVFVWFGFGFGFGPVWFPIWVGQYILRHWRLV